MKLPSLVRLPKYKRFNVEPRYYDPIKEDIEERTSRIKKELEADKNPNAPSDYRDHLHQTFSKRETRERGTTMLQLVIVLILLVAFFGYIIYGNDALYFVLGASTLIYLYFRFNRKSKA